jgi:hypothetical protein
MLFRITVGALLCILYLQSVHLYYIHYTCRFNYGTYLHAYSSRKVERFLIHDFVARLTLRVPLTEEEQLVLPEHLSSSPSFSGVRVTWSLVLCVCFVDRCLSLCTFSFGHCVVCSFSIYVVWLPLWYLQTLPSIDQLSWEGVWFNQKYWYNFEIKVRSIEKWYLGLIVGSLLYKVVMRSHGHWRESSVATDRYRYHTKM